MPFKTFVAGATLTAAEINTNLMNQAVIVCTSGTRPASPVEGMVIYETDTDKLQVYGGAAWVEVATTAAWSTYTPTLTQSGAVTKTVTYARYQRIGRMVTAEFLLSITGTGTAANAVSIGLPFTAAQAANMAAGSGYIFDTSAGVTFGGIAMLATTSTVVLQPTSADAAGALGVSVFAAALASGDSVSGSITYEAAA